MKQEYSFDGVYFPSSAPKSKIVVVFVHQWGGSVRGMVRHIHLVNALGFNAFAFQLLHFEIPPATSLISSSNHLGIKHIYADQVEKVLNEINADKIVFGFSNPAGSAIEAVARRGAADIKALICDSGPAYHFFYSYEQVLKHYYKMESPIKRKLLVYTTGWAWSPYYNKDVREHLQSLPDGFAVLTLQGWQDLISPPNEIEAHFRDLTNIEETRVVMAKAGHVNGIIQDLIVYRNSLESFLRSWHG